MRALVIIDYQNDFVSGPLGSKAAADIEDALYTRCKEYVSKGDIVVFTRDTHVPDSYPDSCEGRHIPSLHCVKGTEGWQIHGSLRKFSERCIVIDKGTFGSEKLADVLEEKGCSDIEIAGVATNICVIVNAAIIRTRLPEAKISIDRRCVASYDSDLGEAALKVMGSFCIDMSRGRTQVYLL